MGNWKDTIIVLCKRILLLIIVFFISRLFYVLININTTGEPGFIDIIKILFYGTRFDYASIIYFNSLFLVLSLLPLNLANRKFYKIITKVLFIVVNSLLILTDLGDAIYYQFSNKRTTFDIFHIGGVGDDLFSLLPSYIKDFWYVFVIWFIIIFILIKFYPEKKSKFNWSAGKSRLLSYSKDLIIYLTLIILLYIPARGIGLKPIRIITAASYVSTNYIPFILNTPFTLITSIQNEELTQPEYFSMEEINTILPLTKMYADSSGFKKKNVVILILESFGKEYIGYYNNNNGYTPFLDSLIRNSLSCSNAFANGTKSIDALPAVIAGIPSLMQQPYITSQYSSNKLSGLGTILLGKGYHTSFFHGGKNGTMGFDHFSHLAGFEHYFGLNEYPNEADFDGNWGIFDEEFYTFYNNKLSSFNEPFASCLFTLSSHHPYLVPKKYKDKFLEGPLEIHKSIEYADYALKTFFEKAKNEEWYNNTLFILTADHTSQSNIRKYQTHVGGYSIPLIFYCPGDSNLKGNITPTVSQIDIMASVLDYINYDTPFFTFGNSVFKSDSNNLSLVSYNGIYQAISNDTAYRFDGNNYISSFAYKTDSLLRENLIESGYKVPTLIDRSIKAFIQQHNYRVKNNKLIPTE